MHLKICYAIIKGNLYNYFYKINLDKIYFFKCLFFSLIDYLSIKLILNIKLKNMIIKYKKY